MYSLVFKDNLCLKVGNLPSMMPNWFRSKKTETCKINWKEERKVSKDCKFLFRYEIYNIKMMMLRLLLSLSLVWVPIDIFVILLCLTPDDFTRHRTAPGWERVKTKNLIRFLCLAIKKYSVWRRRRWGRRRKSFVNMQALLLEKCFPPPPIQLSLLQQLCILD